MKDRKELAATSFFNITKFFMLLRMINMPETIENIKCLIVEARSVRYTAAIYAAGTGCMAALDQESHLALLSELAAGLNYLQL
ncbi:hypothetical protein [Flavobacterium pectinovorum]|uniref:hypothetical protein n=1 Tax=Flavobacterium pectinovorum TaxID=29533 RepID=UPI001FACFE18|nr:hypothetical protein [Flavobacterium pectinovorum]MCI9845501.1 hypothetical protein [Flavobacterium pectinovorum]